MNNRIAIDPSDVIRDGTSEAHGIFTYVSPANIPECIESDFDDRTSTLQISFSYPEQEPQVRREGSNAVEYRIGAHSGRIYKILFKVNRHDKPRMMRELVRAVSNLAKENSTPGRLTWGRGSYEVANSLVREKARSLICG